MLSKISYSLASNASRVTALTVNTTETTVLTISDLKFMEKTQMTVFIDCTLGSATDVKFNYYTTCDQGVTWFKIASRNSTTGLLVDTPTKIDATSPISGGTVKVIDDVPMSATNGIQIRAIATGATATLNSLTVGLRDN